MQNGSILATRFPHQARRSTGIYDFPRVLCYGHRAAGPCWEKLFFNGTEDLERQESEEQPRSAEPVINGHTDAVRQLEKLELSSPAFSHSNRRSGGTFVDASLDPFADDDGFILGEGSQKDEIREI